MYVCKRCIPLYVTFDIKCAGRCVQSLVRVSKIRLGFHDPMSPSIATKTKTKY